MCIVDVGTTMSMTWVHQYTGNSKALLSEVQRDGKVFPQGLSVSWVWVSDRCVQTLARADSSSWISTLRRSYRNPLLRCANPSPCVVPDTHTGVPGFIGSRPLNQHMHTPVLDPNFYAHVSMCLSFLHFRATPRQGSRPKPLSTWHSGSSDMYIFQLLMGQLILQVYDGLKAILIQEKLFLDFLSFPVLEICNMIITCTILNVEFFMFCFVLIMKFS